MAKPVTFFTTLPPLLTTVPSARTARMPMTISRGRPKPVPSGPAMPAASVPPTVARPGRGGSSGSHCDSRVNASCSAPTVQPACTVTVRSAGSWATTRFSPRMSEGQVVARRRRPKSLPRAAAPRDDGRPELRGNHKGCAQLIDGGGQRNGKRLASRQRVLAGISAYGDARVLEAALEVSRDDARQRRRLPTGRWPGAAGTPRRKRPWGRSCRG